MNLALTFAALAKGVLQIDLPARAAEIVDRAMQLATAGRTGPVIVGLPEDVLGETCAPASAAAPARIEAPAPAPAPAAVGRRQRLECGGRRCGAAIRGVLEIAVRVLPAGRR